MDGPPESSWTDRAVPRFFAPLVAALVSTGLSLRMIPRDSKTTMSAAIRRDGGEGLRPFPSSRALPPPFATTRDPIATQKRPLASGSVL